MSYAHYLRELLRPLGVYDLSAPVNGSALEAKGAALDAVQDSLDKIGRESDLTAAEDWGLEAWRQVFSLLPAASDTQQLRESLCALLRIGADSFTLSAVRDTLSGCGVQAMVDEVSAGVVAVSFPGTAGIPQNFEALRVNIEEILPAHVGIEYVFHYLIWAQLEQRGWKWQDVSGMTWDELERAI